MKLEKILDGKTAKVLEFLLENPVLDYSKKDIAEGAGISRSTLYRRWDALEELGVVRETRRYQNTQLYTLDVESEAVNILGRLMQEMGEEPPAQVKA